MRNLLGVGRGLNLKVFHLMSGAPFGGVERQVERLVEAFEGERFIQRAMIRQNHARAERLAARGAVAIEMYFPSRFAFMDRRKINGEIRRFSPDIVVSWTLDTAAFVEKGPFIHLGRIGHEFDSGIFSKCDHLFTPSVSRADTAKAAHWPDKRVHVLPHVPELTRSDEKTTLGTRKKFYTPPNAKLIVTVARLGENSGLKTLFSALGRLSEHYLWVVGDGDSREALEEQAHEAGVKPRTRFIGWHNDLVPIIAAGDAFVYTATQEDVGDAVIEAWGANVPVVAADSLGPGLLINHEKNGLLVPLGDVPSMAEAIKWICRDGELAKKLSGNGKKIFEETYAAKKVVPQYVQLFKQLASELTPKMGM